jgi:hypothetical protein
MVDILIDVCWGDEVGYAIGRIKDRYSNLKRISSVSFKFSFMRLKDPWQVVAEVWGNRLELLPSSRSSYIEACISYIDIAKTT